jgi:hypothetical protein
MTKNHKKYEILGKDENCARILECKCHKVNVVMVLFMLKLNSIYVEY